MYMKAKIPRALKEQLWLSKFGKVFESKCYTPWCKNIINVFDFQCGHDIPESKGGPTDLTNLVPICSRCNTSMSNVYDFRSWSEQGGVPSWKWWFSCCCCKRTQCIVPSDIKVSGIKSHQRSLSQKNRRLQ